MLGAAFFGENAIARACWHRRVGDGLVDRDRCRTVRGRWAIGLKYTDGFTRVGPTIATLVAMVASVWLLSIGMRTLPVGTAYSVWVGVGAIGTVALGIVLFGEPASAARLFSVGLIVAGIVGLKLAD